MIDESGSMDDREYRLQTSFVQSMYQVATNCSDPCPCSAHCAPLRACVMCCHLDSACVGPLPVCSTSPVRRAWDTMCRWVAHPAASGCLPGWHKHDLHPFQRASDMCGVARLPLDRVCTGGSLEGCLTQTDDALDSIRLQFESQVDQTPCLVGMPPRKRCSASAFCASVWRGIVHAMAQSPSEGLLCLYQMVTLMSRVVH